MSKLASEHLVWVFQSSDATSGHPSGVWSSRERAEAWIKRVGAAGMLSAYVLDESAYDSNVRLGMLKLTNPERSTVEFQRRFTSAVEHEHVERMEQDCPNPYPVSLGRDAECRARRREPHTGTLYFQCMCCGAFSLSSVDACEVCRECGWEDWYECHDAPETVVSPNRVSLNVAQSVFMRFGAGACCEVNFSGGVASEQIREIESLSVKDRASLRTARQRVEGS
jgi:hypothetical protein